MNVLHYSGLHTSDKYGGLERWFIEFAKQCGEKKIGVYLSYTGVMPENVELMDTYKSVGLNVILTPKDKNDLLQTIKQYDIDIVFFHFVEPFEEPVFVKKHTQCKIVCFLHCHNYYSSLSWKNDLKILLGVSVYRFKYFFSQFYVDKFVAVSKAVANQHEKFFFLQSHKVECCYLGTQKLLLKRKQDNSTPVICCIACHGDYKGLDVLIRATKLLKERNLSFVVWQVGGGMVFNKGRDTDALKKMVIELNVDDVFSWLGIRNDVAELLDKVDIYVQPSRREAISLTVAEAMMHGLPIVASKVDGLPEYVETGRTGYLYENNDPSLLADKLQLLIEDKSQRIIMGKRGYQKINSDRFDITANISRLINECCKY